MTEIDGENWIIKFPAHVDKKDVGKMEYDYSLCAKACGIVMSETRLFSSDICPGYFGTKRFDRRIEKNEIKRAHMLTAAALLELDFNHRLISVCQTLRKMPKKEKRTIRMLIFPMMRTRMTIRMISCHGPRFRKLLMRLQH